MSWFRVSDRLTSESFWSEDMVISSGLVAGGEKRKKVGFEEGGDFIYIYQYVGRELGLCSTHLVKNSISHKRGA